jgi:hypothetical protein
MGSLPDLVHAAVDDLADDGHLRGEHGLVGGPSHPLEHLARRIADHPRGCHNPTR